MITVLGHQQVFHRMLQNIIKDLFAYDGETNSSQYINLGISIEDPLTNPTISGLPASETLYIDEIILYRHRLLNQV